jgi:hypothetical protein
MSDPPPLTAMTIIIGCCMVAALPVSSPLLLLLPLSIALYPEGEPDH